MLDERIDTAPLMEPIEKQVLKKDMQLHVYRTVTDCVATVEVEPGFSMIGHGRSYADAIADLCLKLGTFTPGPGYKGRIL